MSSVMDSSSEIGIKTLRGADGFIVKHKVAQQDVWPLNDLFLFFFFGFLLEMPMSSNGLCGSRNILHS